MSHYYMLVDNYFTVRIYTVLGIQCDGESVLSPWDTCNRCKCINGKVTKYCRQRGVIPGLLRNIYTTYNFIGCPGNWISLK